MLDKNFEYDIIVVGAGHAGCEAALASAQMGCKTLLLTMDINRIAQMSCNPAIGGIAKGQIVREIDALNGGMGRITDSTSIQFRMLNKSKGPAMWSPRSQSDRKKYIEQWVKELAATPNLHIWQDTATELIIKDKKVNGIKTNIGVVFHSKCIILTCGTFLNGLMHFGQAQIAGGRISEPASTGITEQLKSKGFITGRMKTGTPCRIDKRSIDFSELEEQKGDGDWHKFSFLSTTQNLKQMSCWITQTNKTTHEILRNDLSKSPLYNGQITSIGPRYCPSIETKIVTFADKDSHLLFLEPEGVDSNEYYLNGFSSSLPFDTQIKAIHTIKGLKNAVLYRPGYAIEYDYFDPQQLHHTLETKIIDNLFFAGQINGTTGYEEAAGQGLIAGINAALRVREEEPFILRRDEAYIGVLIDDLINKGVDEPYRMFTSRAEHRILLRQDNADERLTPKAINIGLASKERTETFKNKSTEKKELLEAIKQIYFTPKESDSFLASKGYQSSKHKLSAAELISRPDIGIQDVIELSPEMKTLYERLTMKDEVAEAAEIEIKYEGYIKRECISAEKLRRLEHILIPDNFDYESLQSLSTEARQKLTRVRPKSIGQASRISGVSPNDISVLLILMGR
ncbi:MAG: tRNA uridine-5-carboxymethylaminomethyl(34) synthesis enzyme MnmG [Paludibacteraceae bacterium]|nr:tRNA uridine-5-carboxymethylaminomethyl(34) synthesis enzyme MnmG [Paludibacteraceae bacterium]